MITQERIEEIAAHAAALGSVDSDQLLLQAWARAAKEHLEELSRATQERWTASGGPFAENLRSLVGGLIVGGKGGPTIAGTPAQLSQVATAPGCDLASVSIHSVQEPNSNRMSLYVDVRMKVKA